MRLPRLLTALREHFSIKVFLFFSAFMVIVSAAFTVFFIEHQSSSLSDNLLREGELLAGLLAHNSRLGVFSENEELLRDPVESIIHRNGVISVSVFTSEGKLLMSQVKPTENASDDDAAPGRMREVVKAFGVSGSPLHFETQHTVQFWAPVMSRSEFSTQESLFFGDDSKRGPSSTMGYVQITLDKKILGRQLHTLLLTGILLASVFLIIGTAVTFFMLKRVTRPLDRLTKGVYTIGKGETVEKVPVETTDEIGQLAMAFNTMADSLKKREAEKQNLEEQLRHAHKMEAVGTLSGGVAHDFNNILSAIIGYASLMEMDAEESSRLKHYAEQILASAERATRLTQGLLAFSRKQVINPKPVNLNHIVQKIENLLLRLIGEDVEMKTLLSEQDLPILADSGQIEQILMNLAANARDAMPEGGTLIIETESVTLTEEFIKTHGHGEPGQYALLSVSDSGEGIDEATRLRIFEPFFTTKEVGKGTGLGLSIVYGIVQQHGGYITVESALHEGTTFKIYFPAVRLRTEDKDASTQAPVRGGSETVLVAEDEPEVRKLTTSVLQGFGYRVIEAADGEEAVAQFVKSNGSIQLLLLDVVMPKKNGREAYEEIKKLRPDIKVLFMSGYTADVISRKRVLEEGIKLLAKPVSPKELLKKVREVLDE